MFFRGLTHRKISIVFAFVVFLFGLYVTVTGELTSMLGEDESTGIAINGNKARAIGVGLLVSSLLMYLGSIYGLVLLVILILLPVGSSIFR